MGPGLEPGPFFLGLGMTGKRIIDGLTTIKGGAEHE
jgi:hypothetical protein